MRKASVIKVKDSFTFFTFILKKTLKNNISDLKNKILHVYLFYVSVRKLSDNSSISFTFTMERSANAGDISAIQVKD